MRPKRSIFTSGRERTLWLLAATVVVAIYSTLGLARTLAEELRNRDLLDAVFFASFLAIIGVVVVTGLKGRVPNAAQMAVMLGVGVVYAMVLLRMAIPEERTHLVEYGVLAVIVHEALTERVSGRRRFARPALLAVGVTALLGAADELIQAILPNRVFDPVDIGFNLLAATMAVVARVTLERVSGRRQEA